MNIKCFNTILSIILYGTTSLAPASETYTISFPTHLDLKENGSFDVSIIDSSISDKDDINIKFDDSFILTDTHGKASIEGKLNNTSVNFNSNDLNTKTINYSISNASAGKWSGNIGVYISLEQKAETNLFIDGPSINSILKKLNPQTITFSHNQSGNYLYDLSLAKDESVLLYKNGDEVIIANNVDKPIKANQDMSYVFSDLNVSTINNINYIDMSNCQSMERMFQRSKIVNLDLSSFDTSNVNNMSYCFESMHSLKNLAGLENFDVSNVTTFAYLMNDDMALLTVPNLSGWSVTDKCTNLSYMLASIAYTPGVKSSSLWPSDVDYSGWNVSNVTNMSGLFMGAFNITNLDLTSWDTSKVTNMSSMFRMEDNNVRSALKQIKGIDDFDVRNVIDMSYMFYSCISLTTDNSFIKWNPKNVSSLIYTFYDTRRLELNDFNNWINIIDIDNVDITECFGAQSGNTTHRGYKPQWYLDYS